jgi:hypothetical protein
LKRRLRCDPHTFHTLHIVTKTTMHFWHSLLTLLVVAQLGRAQNQTDNCDTAATAYSDCIAANVGQDVSDDSASCAECKNTQNNALESLADTASCNEILEANCNVITGCLSVCSDLCEAESVAYLLCNLAVLATVLPLPNCDYQCIAGNANATTGSASGTTGNPTSSPIDRGTEAPDTGSTSPPNETVANPVVGAVGCEAETTTFQTCLASSSEDQQAQAANTTECTACQAAGQDYLSAFNGSTTCNAILEANCELLKTCITECAPICGEEYLSLTLCSVSLPFSAVGGCDYECTTGNGTDTPGTNSGTANNGTDDDEVVSHSSERLVLLCRSWLAQKSNRFNRVKSSFWTLPYADHWRPRLDSVHRQV